ncbi:MAG: hypothetical protein JXQ90_10985, partial [Cyclobacteriaceae bacterium]
AVGTHDVRAIATDTAGNVSDTTFTGVITITEPNAQITITSLSVTGGDIEQGQADVLVYGFSVDVLNNQAIWEGGYLTFAEGFNMDVFEDDGIKLLSNTTDDFATATQVATGAKGLAVPTPEFPVPANGFGFDLADTLADGSTTYYYVTMSVKGTATAGLTFGVVTPTGDHFGFADPKEKIDGGLLAGATFTIVASDLQAPVASMQTIYTNDRTPVLTGTIDDIGGTATIELAGASYSATVLPNGTWLINDNVVAALTDGYHDLTITASDSLLNTASYVITDAVFVDATSPTVVTANVYTNNQAPGLSGTVNDAGATISINVAGKVYEPLLIGSSWAIARLDSLNDGYYDMTITSVDSLGNQNVQVIANAIFVDATAPTIHVRKTLSIEPSPIITGSVSETPVSISVSVNGNTYGGNSIKLTGNKWEISQGTIPELADGTYEITAVVTDSLGNASQDTSSNELIVETDELLVSVDNLITNDRTPTLTGLISSEAATVTVTLAGESYTAVNNGDGSWTLAGEELTANLSQGVYDVEATASDPIGLTGADNTTDELRIDLRPPTVRIDDIETLDNQPKITGIVDGPKTSLSFELGGKSYKPERSSDTTWFVAKGMVNYLEPGRHDARILATDIAGNVGVDSSVIRILPRAVVALPATNKTVNSFTANWTTEQGVSTYLLTVSRERNARKKLLLKDAPVTESSYTVTDLFYGEAFYYRVRAVYSSGDTSNYSNIISTRTLTDPNTAIDSLALVSIFNSTNGVYWEDRGNWLQGKLFEWKGVTMTGTRVTKVDLSNNGLEGTIPTINDGLERLTELNVAENELDGIGDLSSLTSLNFADIVNNRLIFSEISKLTQNGLLVNYSPQKEVLDAIRTLQQVGNGYVINRSVGGGTSYSWYKNGEAISQSGASFEVAIQSFSDEGVYHAEVTSSSVSGLTLTTTPVYLRVSSLQRDSSALIAIYEALVTDEALVDNWKDKSINDWEEIVIENQRVVSFDLSNVQLAGKVPQDILDIGGLRDVDFSGNSITAIPDLSELTNITRFDISRNNLDFASIEPNVNVSGIDYSDQAEIGVEKKDTIPRGDNYYPNIITRGSSLKYQWFFNGSPITNEGNNDFYAVRDIDINKMGSYSVEVSSTLVPNFKLTSKTQTVTATADIEYFPGFKYADGVPGILNEGQSLLFKITPTGPYDTVGIVPVRNDAVLFEDVVLGDYLLLVENPDTTFSMKKEYAYSSDSISIDTVRFIPTYYESSLEWDSANVLELRDFISDTLDLLRIPPPLPYIEDGGIIGLLVESDFGEDEVSGRIESRRRVKKAGCSLRRRTTGGGGRTAEDVWELIAYKETDDNGEVNFGNLPVGSYRLNIQYPGVPMDPTSFVEFEITDEEEGDGYELAATVATDGIVVEVVEELGFYRHYFKDLNVYPNPTADYININYRRLNARSVEMNLMDLGGNIIRTETIRRGRSETIQFDIRDLEDGIY